MGLRIPGRALFSFQSLTAMGVWQQKPILLSRVVTKGPYVDGATYLLPTDNYRFLVFVRLKTDNVEVSIGWSAGGSALDIDSIFERAPLSPKAKRLYAIFRGICRFATGWAFSDCLSPGTFSILLTM